MLRTLGFSALLVLICACGDTNPLAPRTDSAADAVAGRRISVVTRNLYVGADVDAVIAALASPSPDDDRPALLQAIETLEHTDFPTRARAIADEIARTRPHAVGLQEVSQVQIAQLW